MSKKFNEYKQLNLTAVANEVLQYWKKHETFKKSIHSREGKDSFVFYDGPPSANGMPGIHHVISRSIKDIFCRYQTLKGKQVIRKAGWDTHGLPVELGVEKQLGITKEDIGKTISVAEYNEACKKSVMQFTDKWADMSEKMGYWVDMDHPYVTYDSKYMESLWWLLKQIYNKKWLYKGYTIQPYSPVAGTGLSSHELNLPGTYRDVTDTTIVAQFKAKKESTPLFDTIAGDIYFLAWTTTPWTLPSNTALTIGKNIDYVLIKTFNQYTFEPIQIILAQNLVEKQFGKKYFKVKENSFTDNLFKDFSYALKESETILNRKARKLKVELIIGRILSFDEFDTIEKIVARKNMTNLKEHLNSTTLNDISIETIEKLSVSQINSTNLSFPYQILKKIKGSDLVGIQYEQLLPWALPYENAEKAFRVIVGDFVTTEDGTGIVHTAPTFGADDAFVAKKHGVPPMLVKDENDNLVPLVDLQGRFIQSLNNNFAGKYVKNEYYKENPPKKSTDIEIAILLKTENKAFKVEKYIHSYPHCWRTDKPILYYPLDSWFVKATAVKERMQELNKTINWKPKSTGEGRFGNWLENVNDWNLSRSRYWGVPLPIWRTEEGDEELIIGSIDEIICEIEKSIQSGFMKENPYQGFETGNKSRENYNTVDLHKHIVDEIILVSPTGKPMKREADLIDVWFDSGAMPYAQHHYPFENKDLIDQRKAFPADFIAEGVDQTRGWFYTLHVISTMVFDQISYKNVISNGLVLDKNGQKMSKRLGNGVDPFETLAKYGPDTTRWYMISNAQPWENLKFDIEGIDEVRRKFFGTLYNTYSFFALYANLDNFDYESEIPVENRTELDRWIISELNTLVKDVDASYSDYEPTRVARAVYTFVTDNLSNWYVRLNRRRFWKGEYSEDKKAAYQTLYTCLVTVAKLSSPIAPFFMDRLYQDLNNVTKKEPFESVHLTDFPIADETLIDQELQERTHLAQKVTSMVFSLRKREQIKVRQPLQKIMIPVLNSKLYNRLEIISDIIKQEVNVKEIELLTNEEASGVLVKQIKPNFKTLGPKFGKNMKQIAAHVAQFDQDTINSIETNGGIMLEIEGENIELIPEDFEISTKDIEGWLVTSEGGLTVALDIQIDEPLKAEGIARELVNRIQNLRKDSGFEVSDKINILIQHQEDIKKSVDLYYKYICDEVLGEELQLTESIKNGTDIDFDEIKTRIQITKI
ncbi:MAG: isoleucine--tRNA ligase [Flavobacteriales bacterium]